MGKAVGVTNTSLIMFLDVSELRFSFFLEYGSQFKLYEYLGTFMSPFIVLSLNKLVILRSIDFHCFYYIICAHIRQVHLKVKNFNEEKVPNNFPKYSFLAWIQSLWESRLSGGLLSILIFRKDQGRGALNFVRARVKGRNLILEECLTKFLIAGTDI